MGPVRLVNKGEIEGWLVEGHSGERKRHWKSIKNRRARSRRTHPFRSRADCICNAGFRMEFRSDRVHQHYNHGILIRTGPYSPLVVGEVGPFHVKGGPLGMNESHACCFSFSYAWRQLVCLFFEVSQKYAMS